MKEFIEEIFIHKSKFKQIKIGYVDKKKIQESALCLLKLKDFGQLRDRFEGDLFYRRFTKELMAEIALEKYLGIKFINWEAKSKLKDFPSKIIYENIKIGITTIDFAEYPILIDEIVSSPQIFCIKKGQESINICGIATTEILKVKRKSISNMPMVLGKKVIFTGFEDLKVFEDFEDLKKILEI